MTIYENVYDLTQLVQKNYGPEVEPMVKAAGRDVSHWFDPKTREPKSYVNPQSNVREYYTPNGRYLHIPPALPDSSWDNSFKTP